MSLVLSNKATKLLKLCDSQGFDNLEALLKKCATDSICPAICMTEGCDYAVGMEPDQNEGYCEVCGGTTMVSALVLVGVI